MIPSMKQHGYSAAQAGAIVAGGGVVIDGAHLAGHLLESDRLRHLARRRRAHAPHAEVLEDAALGEGDQRRGVGPQLGADPAEGVVGLRIDVLSVQATNERGIPTREPAREHDADVGRDGLRPEGVDRALVDREAVRHHLCARIVLGVGDLAGGVLELANDAPRPSHGAGLGGRQQAHEIGAGQLGGESKPCLELAVQGVEEARVRIRSRPGLTRHRRSPGQSGCP